MYRNYHGPDCAVFCICVRKDALVNQDIDDYECFPKDTVYATTKRRTLFRHIKRATRVPRVQSNRPKNYQRGHSNETWEIRNALTLNVNATNEMEHEFADMTSRGILQCVRRHFARHFEGHNHLTFLANMVTRLMLTQLEDNEVPFYHEFYHHFAVVDSGKFRLLQNPV